MTSTANGPLWGHKAQDWADFQETQHIALFEAVLDKAAVGLGTRYLDAGCGSGLAAQMAAARGANVAGVDAAEAMIEIARRRTPEGKFQVGELEDLPFEDDTFDLVTGINSFQFAGDPAEALREARRVAKPDATVVIVAWANPEGMQAAELVKALGSLLPPPPPNAPGPFALSDPEAIRDLARIAGLKPHDLFEIECAWSYPDLATALRGLKSAGVVAKALQQISEASIDASFLAALKPFEQADGSYRVEARFQCLFTTA